MMTRTILKYVFSFNKSVTKAEQIPLIEEDSDRSVEVAVAAKAFEK
jgi:hypothetical protein